ncbi:hypothetical protein MHBO_003955 [Bonamia ostreae]|uniref:Uncharacterized protein n=1 Tax=Bonamia ostreae TaxID=126728 RepID=A0ABV2ARZ4_9EUKA
MIDVEVYKNTTFEAILIEWKKRATVTLAETPTTKGCSQIVLDGTDQDTSQHIVVFM